MNLKKYFRHLTTLSCILLITMNLTSSAQALYNDGAEITIQAGATLTVVGDFQNEGDGTIDNAGTMQVSGDWINNAPLNFVFASPIGTVELNGNGQTISGETSFNHLDLSTGTGDVTALATEIVEGNLLLGDRVLILPNLEFFLIENSSPTAISRNTGYILSEDEDNTISWNIGNNTGVYTFPFGTASGDYIPLDIEVNSTTGTDPYISASTYPTADNNTPTPLLTGPLDYMGNDVSANSVDRYWNVELNDRTADVTFTYAPADLVGNSITEADLVALNYDDANFEWANDYTGAYNGVGSYSFTANISLSGNNEVFTLYAPGAVAPIVRAYITLTLEGPYDAVTGDMVTTLRANNLLPLTQPFDRLPWNYAGLESVATANDIPINAVDWMLFEVRDALDATVVVSQKAAFLLSDGTVQDINGNAGVEFTGLTNGNSYHLVARSRNHLANISANTTALPNTVATPFDFSNPTNLLGGMSQVADLGNGNYGQFGGDFNSDGVITVADFNFYQAETAIINEYRDSDANMDKAVTVADFNVYQPNTSVIGVAEIRY